MSDVNIKIRANTSEIYKSLGDLKNKFQEAAKSLPDQAKNAEKSYGDNFRKITKHADNFLARFGSLGKKTLKQLGDDFKSLFSAAALRESLKMTDKFRDRALQVMTLNDAIRKMGSSFGIASKDFGRFQAAFQKGLGDVGIGSDAAANALEGLQGTQIKGQENIVEFAKQASMIAALTGEAGQEGVISKGMADIALKGFSAKEIADAQARIQMGSGMKGTESIALMKDVLTSMTPDQIKGMGGLKGIEDLAIIMQKSGKESADFFKKFMSSTFPGRQVLEAQGAKGIFGEKGFNATAFKKFIDELKTRSTDPKFALTTAGMSEENATAFLKLADSLDQVKTQTDLVNKSFVSTQDSLIKQRGFAESFGAAINKVFGNIPLSRITQPLTEMFSQMAESDVGSAAMVGGSAAIAAMLAGFGMKGIGKGLGIGKTDIGGLAKGVGMGSFLKQAGIQPVYVVNAQEIGKEFSMTKEGISDLMGATTGGVAGQTAGGAMASKMGLLGKAGLVGGALVGGYAIGSMIEPMVSKFLDEKSMRTTEEGFTGNAIERMMFNIGRMFGGFKDWDQVAEMQKSGQIKVVMADPRLKEVHAPPRGGSFE